MKEIGAINVKRCPAQTLRSEHDYDRSVRLRSAFVSLDGL